MKSGKCFDAIRMPSVGSMDNMELAWNSRPLGRRALRAGVIAIGIACIPLFGGIAQTCTPSLSLDAVPRAGGGPIDMEMISGKVTCVDAANDKLIIYSRAAGIYWIQPFDTSPDTYLSPRGEFRAQVHLGSDYHILVTTKGYVAAPKLQILPPEGGSVLAVFSPIVPSSGR